MRSFSLNLGSDFQNAPIGLKLDMNGPNNILNRLNLLLRSSKVKYQLGVKCSICSDLVNFDRNDHDNIVNRLNLLSRSMVYLRSDLFDKNNPYNNIN